MRVKRWNARKSDRKGKPAADISVPLKGDFVSDLERVRQVIGHNSDVQFREFNMKPEGIRAAIIFVDGLANKVFIDTHILKPLMESGYDRCQQEQSIAQNAGLHEWIANDVFSVSTFKKVRYLSELISEVLWGSTALLIDGFPEVFIVDTRKWNTRNIEEPVTEALVRGPRIGFIEDLNANIGLLRQQGMNACLSIVKLQVGKRVRKDLAIAYTSDIADSDLVEEVISRVRKIDIDHVIDSGYVEQLIEDNMLSPFPQVQHTERPDCVMSALMEGRVAILLEGSPSALIVPVTFGMLLQSPEDYYERWIPGSLIRLLRFAAALVTLLGPALYISFISFHPGMIPTKLAVSISGTREGVPFPSLIEALIMEVSIEILREAGLRLPRPIGPAMGIVGGLIIGEAAVQAGLVSPIMVIVVAITAISSFTIPHYSAGISLRMLRFAAMFSAAVFGLYGVVLFFLLICSHLVKLKSFGVPYASPAMPFRLGDWKDFMFRMPLSMMKRRPKTIPDKNPIRKD